MGVKKVCVQTSLDAKNCFHKNQIKLHQSNFFYSSEDRKGKIFLVEKLLQQKKSLFSDAAEKKFAIEKHRSKNRHPWKEIKNIWLVKCCSVLTDKSRSYFEASAADAQMQMFCQIYGFRNWFEAWQSCWFAIGHQVDCR